MRAAAVSAAGVGADGAVGIAAPSAPELPARPTMLLTSAGSISGTELGAARLLLVLQQM